VPLILVISVDEGGWLLRHLELFRDMVPTMGDPQLMDSLFHGTSIYKWMI
jgi:hypothetical protein